MKKPLLRQLLFFIIVIATLLPLIIFPIISNNFHELNSCPQVTDAVLNLDSYDFSQSPAIPLNGNWRYYEGVWIITDKQIDTPAPILTAVPTPWHRHNNSSYNQAQSRKESYSITLTNYPKDANLTSFIPNMNTTYRMYINGNVVYSNDSLPYVNSPQQDTYTQFNNAVPQRGNKKAELVIELLNSSSHNLYFTPMLSESKKVLLNFIKNNSIFNIYIGIVILAIACFATVVFLKDKSFSSIFLLILDFIVLFRLLFKNKLLILYIYSHFNADHDIFNGFMIATTLFLPIIFLFCACQLLDLTINKNHMIAILIYELFFCPFIFFSAQCGHVMLVQILCLFSYLPFIYILRLIFKEVKNNKPYILAVTAILLLLISAIIISNMFTFGLLVIDTSLYSASCVVLSLILQITIYLSKNHQTQMEMMELEKLRINIKENEMAMKLSQIKPHFLYNALIAIQVLCTEEPDTAAEATMQFANYMRENMHFINSREPVPFQRELNHIKNYAAIEKLRFQDRLTIEMDIKAENFLLPPLTIQPIIENAIKHGACKNINGGRVILSTFETTDNFCIRVEDNGPGFDIATLEQKPDSIGIDNISFRLKELMHGEIEIKSILNQGTTVIVRLPKEAGI